MSGNILVESPMMMNIGSAVGQLGTPPMRRRHGSPAAFVQCLRETRSPSPKSYPESILRVKHTHKSPAETTNQSSVKSSRKLCSHNKISSCAGTSSTSSSSLSSSSTNVLSNQLGQISLSTGTAGIASGVPESVSAENLAQKVQEPRVDKHRPNFFLLDCRSFIAFNLKKICGALNVCCTDRCSRRRLTSGKSSILDMVKGTDDEKDTFKKNLQAVDIILYDDNTQALELKDSNSTLQLVAKVLQLQGANVRYLQGGLEAFQQKYDRLCVTCTKPCNTPLYSPTSAPIQEPANAIDTATASQILPFLYLGNERDAGNESRLRELKITHILNVTAHIPFFAEQQKLGLKCKRLPASDSGQQNLKQYFHTASDFIDEVRSEGGRVLIHCHAGVSRSATITLAYIMLHSHLTMQEAFSLLKSRRSIVSPNFNFMGQLYSLEQALLKGDEQRKLSPPLDLGIPTPAVFSPTPAVPQTPAIMPQTPAPFPSLEVVPPTPTTAVPPPTALPQSMSMSHLSENGFKFC